MDFGKLHIENFGPIKNADIELGRVNVFIGSQGVGKSVIGKLLHILGGTPTSENTMNGLIEDFILLPERKANTKITYSIPKVQQEIKVWGLNNFELVENINHSKLEENNSFKDSAIYEQQLNAKSKKNTFALNGIPNKTRYIPEFRGFLASTKGRSVNWLRNIKFDEYILDFLENLEWSKEALKSLNAPFLNRNYEFGDADFAINTKTNEKINLRQEASGIKTVMPILAVCNYYANHEKRGNKYHFIIEEPELNLYPKTQVALMTYLIENCIKNQHQLTITTHSPYMLTAINNLCMAYQAGQVNSEKTNKVVPKNAWLNPEEVKAYHVGNGTVHSIFNKEAGLIDSNEIDDASDDIIDVFEELSEIYVEKFKKV